MSKEPNGDRWSRAFDKAKDTITHAPKDLARVPKNAAESVGKTIGEHTEPLRHDMKTGFNNVKNYASGIKNASGFGGKLKAAANPLGNKLKNSEAAKTIKKMVETVRKIANFVAANIKPIAIISAVVLVLGNGAIFVISIAQSATPTPHYYCDTEANSSIRKTSVYRQYCTQGGFSLENLQGHYIVQDGSGPCTDCAFNNLLMRYYTDAGLNYFDYLWDEAGEYGPSGQICRSTNVATPGTLRKIINGGGTGTTDCTAKYDATANGTVKFGQLHGKNITMANWGYLRDDSIEDQSWAMSSTTHPDNSANEKWVWDLSLPDNSAGTTWNAGWGSQTITIDDIECNIIHLDNSSITGETVKDVLSGSMGSTVTYAAAGCIVYYKYPKSGGGTGNHAVLITGYDSNTGEWTIIDSALGLAGGYEGPVDNSGNFCIYGNEVKNLLNCGSNSNGSWSIISITFVGMSIW